MDKKKIVESLLELLGNVDMVKILSGIQCNATKEYMKDHTLKVIAAFDHGMDKIELEVKTDIPKDFPDFGNVLGYLAFEVYCDLTLKMLKMIEEENGEPLPRKKFDAWLDDHLRMIRDKITKDKFGKEEEENDG